MINLLQVDVPRLPKIYTPYLSGLWCITLDGSQSFTDSNGVTGTVRDLAQITPSLIGALRLGLLYYDEVNSVEACWNNPATYFYMSDTFQIIVNISDDSGVVGYQVPWGKRLEVGIITGYSDHVDYSREDQTYYNDMYYRPCISQTADYSSKRDKLFYGINSYTSVDIDLDNHDGHFDGLKMLGSVARQYTLEDGAELTPDCLVQYGIITKVNTANQKTTITIGDRRKSLDTNINLGYVGTAKYPYLYDADDDTSDNNTKIIPIAIGQIKNYVPSVIDKANHSAGTASYLLTAVTANHTLQGVQRVWLQKTDEDGVNYDVLIPAVGETLTATPISKDSKRAVVSDIPYTIDYANGLLLINRATVCTAEESDNKITYNWIDVNVDYTGWYNNTAGENTNLCGVDLIKIALNAFGNIDYESWNFDLATFAGSRKTSLNQVLQGRIYSNLIDSDTSITDFIKTACEAFDTILTCRTDGRYAVKVIANEESISDIKYEIKGNQLIDRADNNSTTITSLLSTVSVDYGYAGNSDNKLTLTDSTRETDVEETYHTTQSSDFSTNLATVEGAQLKADAILDATESLNPLSDFTVWADTDLKHLDCVDTIIAPSGRTGTRAIYNITEIKKSNSKNQVTITALKMADIKYDDTYIQGAALGVSAYGVSVYGVSQYIL